MKKEFSIIRDNETYRFTIIGFPDKKNSYGEIYMTDSSHTTYVFRGFERQAVLKAAKKRIEDK
ncbi:hypothetical protein FZC78_07670 [Rossellomorea vietnamensis]|uniref:DUF1508 domain-containing protein n=1 Tax=Rossellomorea vietnamensis TaxID=218284 RepID=A0A5D4NV31_9BACI|nr:hypothetical protein [Rossellomorea vietnamensis]TYS17729.1 hypothetical protein FZC78_07670 [Rossellomorea vietnamensis]